MAALIRVEPIDSIVTGIDTGNPIAHITASRQLAGR